MGIANKVCDFFEFWYYQYILVTALYMLEFWERAVFSILGVLKTRFKLLALLLRCMGACPFRRFLFRRFPLPRGRAGRVRIRFRLRVWC